MITTQHRLGRQPDHDVTPKGADPGTAAGTAAPAPFVAAPAPVAAGAR